MDKVVVHIYAETKPNGHGRWHGSLRCRGVTREIDGDEYGLNLLQIEIHAMESVVRQIKRPCCLEIFMASGPLMKLVRGVDPHEGYHEYVLNALKDHAVQWYWINDADQDLTLLRFRTLSRT